MRIKMNTQAFIVRARAVHGDEYCYSKVEYVSAHKGVIIICADHGEFMVTPYNHLVGVGCPVEKEEEETVEIVVGK
jgi:hypothetical protein